MVITGPIGIRVGLTAPWVRIPPAPPFVNIVPYGAFFLGDIMQNIAFFDIDGTLFSSEIGFVRPVVKKAISRAQKQGWICCVASGRSYGFLPREIKEMGFDAYLCCNGSVVLYRDQLLIHDVMDVKDVSSLVEHLKQRKIEYDLQRWDHTELEPTFKHLRSYFQNSGIEANVILEPNGSFENCVKIEMWINDALDLDHILEKSSQFSYEIHTSTQHVEFFPKRHTKASAAAFLMEKFSIQESYSFGDSMNDHPLAQLVDHPVAMGNAIEDLKEIAEIIAPSVEQDGVAVVLNHLLNHIGDEDNGYSNL